MRKIKLFLTIGVLVIASAASPSTVAFSQGQTRRVVIRGGCSYYSRHQKWPRAVFAFGTTAEAKAAVDKILSRAGLVRNFEIEAADVENAEAGIDGNNKPYIYYNQSFMDMIAKTTRTTHTNWGRLSIMSHEIAHHLLGHTFGFSENHYAQEANGNRYSVSRQEQELDADRYSGHILRFLGASLEEAQAAVNTYADERGSDTHPAKQSRLAAIRYGWGAADEIIKEEAVKMVGHPAPPLNPRPNPLRPAPRPAPQPSRGAFRISAHNTSQRAAQGWWNWTVFMNAQEEELNRISCVEYTLDPSFVPNMTRVCDRGTGPAFALRRKGWGEFRIKIRVLTKDDRWYELFHDLKL